ncbi:MAG TPA: hypothetical protein VMD28_02345, partial [Acidimicrobiales bacterium]|nr:hypothetical protein [Acidimicrobiales bacterium]
MTLLRDPDADGDSMRRALYDGNLLLLSGLASVAALVQHARDELSDLFAPHDPELAHEYFDRSTMAKILGAWKPAFIHSERSTSLVRQIVAEAGFDPAQTHYDVPKPRTAFPVGHLTTGIAYAFPWHRDTWYCAPSQQLNWWLPIYPIREDNSMSFDLQSFGRHVPNSSATFDYYLNNVYRLHTASQVTKEQQPRPAASDDHTADDYIVLPDPGEVLVFSGAHLHRTIPNTSGRARYSIDFRTVDVSDLLEGRGAPSVDAYCTGTAIRDFHNVADGSPF